MTDKGPFNLNQWIEDNAEFLVPPVSNCQIWEDADMIVMIVGGGNERSDYHDDPREEFFYQLRGDMFLKIVDAPGSPSRDLTIREGDIYLLAPGVRHSPQRPDPDSIGLVVEYARSEGELDGFEWFCSNCHALVHRVEVQLESIVTDLPPLFQAFHNNTDARTCGECGTVHPTAAEEAKARS